MKCQLCGNDVNRLTRDTEGLEVCADCHEQVEGFRPEGEDLEDVTIMMDPRMLRALEAKSDVEGFTDVTTYIHSILFREAVAMYLEELGVLECPEQEAAFTRELREWLVRR